MIFLACVPDGKSAPLTFSRFYNIFKTTSGIVSFKWKIESLTLLQKRLQTSKGYLFWSKVQGVFGMFVLIITKLLWNSPAERTAGRSRRKYFFIFFISFDNFNFFCEKKRWNQKEVEGYSQKYFGEKVPSARISNVSHSSARRASSSVRKFEVGKSKTQEDFQFDVLWKNCHQCFLSGLRMPIEFMVM